MVFHLVATLLGCIVIDSPWIEDGPDRSGFDTGGSQIDTSDPVRPDTGSVSAPVYSSCLEILESGVSEGDGVYAIDPGGLGEVEVYCDMSTDGGGWTLIQRTVWDWQETWRLDTDYGTLYAERVGDPAPGRAFRLDGARWQALNARGEHLVVHTLRDAEQGADCAPLAYRGDGGWLDVSPDGAALTGLTSEVEIASSESLSAVDVGPASWCAEGPRYGVPWFYEECCHTCPAFKNDYWSDAPHPMVNYVQATPDLAGLVAADVCPSGAALPNENDGPYVGANAMAWMLR